VDFEFQDKIDYLLGLSKVGDSQLVIGGGTVQYRKGVDLFIEVARQVRAKRGLEDTVFAWIGDGYDPLHDFNYSVYLRDQIARSDLTRNLRVIQASASYQYALDRCSVFCLSSRLDPLPNVALDAMKSGRPIAFFEEASGLSELVGGMEVLSKGAAPYLDTAELANRVSDLLLMSRKQSFSKISREIRQFANENLSLRVYARRLIQLI
jgi:glycosyltransferase involved in cell wall biosynthesis